MSKKKKKRLKRLKRLKEFESRVEHWRDLLGITSFDLSVEQGTLDDGTLADVTRDVDSRSCAVRLHEPPEGNDDLDSLARHEMIHVLLADLSALAHSREATHAEIERAEEALVVRLTRLL